MSRNIEAFSGEPAAVNAARARSKDGGRGEKPSPTEGEHILGDLLRRAAKPDDHSLLRIAYLNVKAYEAGRTRGEPSTT